MDALLKSAAWEGIDINTLDEYCVIDKVYEETSKEGDERDKEVHTYYMFYLPKDINGVKKGTPVLQDGLDGMYTTLSNNDLYEDCKKLMALQDGDSVQNDEEENKNYSYYNKCINFNDYGGIFANKYL